MSVRVIARIRPLSKLESDRDCIISTASSPNDFNDRPNIIKLPNPRNAAEAYSFQFQSVYDHDTSQQELFDNEVSGTVKPLFNGLDVTIFAYGCTGSGKTHTMRGGKSLAERGIIPRLLSSVHRRARKVEKDTNGAKRVEISMSYYEIYNDRVFDLFEPPEKRTTAGLPIRDNNGKTIVAGLTERPCTTLKEFENLYDFGNINRSTSATKLNAHSSRSHAILCLKIVQTTEDQSITSTVSAIDLAGSEDNRRTENGKERLVESSSINKSLFVLAQCVEAISKKQARIPYRESKMTRILSLGQNNGLTIMILNLAPVRSYHLDTLSSLNFANRTKKIEIREIENEPVFKGTWKQPLGLAVQTTTGSQRQPLRAITTTAANIGLKTVTTTKDKPAKAFTVYAENERFQNTSIEHKTNSMKRASDSMHDVAASRPSKKSRTSDTTKSLRMKENNEICRADIEALVNQMVDEKLATHAMKDNERSVGPAMSNELKRRLEALEQRVEQKEDSRTEGLQFLLMAKQHQAHGEDSSALKMYQLALPFFPHNEKLAQKMVRLQDRLKSKASETTFKELRTYSEDSVIPRIKQHLSAQQDFFEDDYNDKVGYDELEKGHDSHQRTKVRKLGGIKLDVFRDSNSAAEGPPSPRTEELLRVINSRDLAQIKTLKGLGVKKAESIVNYICTLDETTHGQASITSLMQLQALKGVGEKTVTIMRSGITL